ncbi:MAG TPA: CopG family transcriptional regulator [Thermoanaerobaculia bacterium]|nr:CopG family transcriptional regulator [Thermoanaerobaculia bacterium]
MYGIMYGMRKTTIYLPDELKSDVERIAEAENRTEADVIRDAIAVAVSARRPEPPRIPLFDGELSDPTIAERVEELLEGFGR